MFPTDSGFTRLRLWAVMCVLCYKQHDLSPIIAKTHNGFTCHNQNNYLFALIVLAYFHHSYFHKELDYSWKNHIK